MEKHKIFLDLDGVLVDLDSGLKNICNFEFPKERNGQNRILVENMWDNLAKSCPDFWHGLPPMNDYLDLWRFCKQHKPFVLSATPEIYNFDKRHYECAHYKRMWVQLWLGIDMLPRTIITKSKLKQNVISQMDLESPILIDDHVSNIDRWNSAGGIGILHKNSRDTLKELKEILKNEK